MHTIGLITFIGRISAVAVAVPVAPEELPSQYLRVDSRRPYQFQRDFTHHCSYPNHPFSCADLATDPAPYIAKLQSDPDFMCGECRTAGNASVASFCTKDVVEGVPSKGKWGFKKVFYTDAACQEVSHIDNKTYHWPYLGVATTRDDSRCYIYSQDKQCSPVSPAIKPTCTYDSDDPRICSQDTSTHTCVDLLDCYLRDQPQTLLIYQEWWSLAKPHEDVQKESLGDHEQGEQQIMV